MTITNHTMLYFPKFYAHISFSQLKLGLFQEEACVILFLVKFKLKDLGTINSALWQTSQSREANGSLVEVSTSMLVLL